MTTAFALFFNFIVILFTGSYYALGLSVKPEKPVGIDGEKLEIRVDSEYSFKTCRFSHWGSTDDLIVVSELNNSSDFAYWENEEKTLCKLIIISMRNDWKGQWNVTLDDNTQNLTKFSVGMTVQKPVATDVAVTAEVGSIFNRSCDYDQKYARVFNPQGILVSEGDKAGIVLPFVRIQDAGVWLCLVQMGDRLSELKISITLNVTSTTAVYTSVDETTTHVNLLCRHFDSVSNIPCLFLSPTGNTFAPHEGVPFERYKYYGNDTDNDCGMSIKKPLVDSEKGFWKCMMTSPKHASILKVYANDTAITSSTKMSNISIILSDSYQSKLTVQCNYPEPLTYCYARSPAGRIYSAIAGGDVQVAAYTGMGLNQGDCQITIDGEHLWKNESGTWLCGMGVEGFDDIQVKINVLISDNHFRAEVNNHQVNTGEKVKLMCRSVMGYGLRYCRFNHPTGKSLNLGYHSSSLNNRFSYMGKGLEAGDCGLLIDEFQTDDFGVWTCATAFVGNSWLTEFQDSVTLSPAPLGLGSIVGISVTLGILGILAAGVLVFWQLRRRSKGPSLLEAVTLHNPGQRGFDDSASDTSNSHHS